MSNRIFIAIGGCQLVAFAIVAIFSFRGDISFGLGLGDLVLSVLSSISVFTLLVTILILVRNIKITNSLQFPKVSLLVHFVVLMYLVYCITIGKGME